MVIPPTHDPGIGYYDTFGPEAHWLNTLGAFDVLDWIELLATAHTPTLYGSRLAWFLWDLARATTQHQLTTGWDFDPSPNQANTHRPLPPCTCRYHPSSSVRGFVFSIDPMCTHHGADLVRQAARLGLHLERWQLEVYEASIRNGIPIKFTPNRRRRW